jgi:anti-sigma factor RsiW
MDTPPDVRSNGLTCRALAPQWSSYLDDALPALMTRRMTSHVSTCPDCHRYLRQITIVRDALHALTRGRPSAGQQRFLRERFAARHPHTTR